MPSSHPRPWHRDSRFGVGPRQPLDREQRARVLFLARMHRRPGGLSAGGLQVLVAMLRLLGADGRLDPSHATLAALVKVHVATVQRALERLRSLGLLFWQRRLVRTGRDVRQASNAYALTTEGADMQIARAVKVVSSKKDRSEAQPAVEARHATLTALAAIAARRMRSLGLA